jgi:hypothetical protein
MIEVHLVRLESTSAIDARAVAEFPKELDGSALPDPHAGDFEIAVALVIRDVRRPLIRPSHSAIIEPTV